MGVVYYANYFVWFEVGRADCCDRSAGPTVKWSMTGVALPVIEAHCDYRRPARYDDEMEVRTKGRMLSPVRMEFTYEVVRPRRCDVAASGRTVHAALDSGRKAVPASRAHQAAVRMKASSPAPPGSSDRT